MRRMRKSLCNLVLLVCFNSPAARAECTTCPDGIEFPEADPLGDGFYKCSNIDDL